MAINSTLLSYNQAAPMQPDDVTARPCFVDGERATFWATLSTAQKEDALAAVMDDLLQVPWDGQAIIDWQVTAGPRFPTYQCVGGYIDDTADTVTVGSAVATALVASNLLYSYRSWKPYELVGGSVIVTESNDTDSYTAARITAHDTSTGTLTLADAEFGDITGKDIRIVWPLRDDLRRAIAIQAAERYRGKGQIEHINERMKAGLSVAWHMRWHPDAVNTIRRYAVCSPEVGRA